MGIKGCWLNGSCVLCVDVFYGNIIFVMVFVFCGNGIGIYFRIDCIVEIFLVEFIVV